MPDQAAIAPSQIAASRQIAVRELGSNVTPVFGAYANHPASVSDRCRLMVTASAANASPVATTMTVRCRSCTSA
jgi:hypothetical protein